MWTRASWAVVGSLLWTATAWSQAAAPSASSGAATPTWRNDAAVVPAAGTTTPGTLPPAPGATPVMPAAPTAGFPGPASLPAGTNAPGAVPAAAGLPGPGATAGTPATAQAGAARTPIAKVTAGNGQLPNDQGAGLARVRHHALHATGYLDRSARAGDCRLDPPRDRLRAVALRAAGHLERDAANPSGVSYSRGPGDRRRSRRSVRQHRDPIA